MARPAAEAPQFDRRVCVDTKLTPSRREILDVSRRYAHGRNRTGLGTLAMEQRVRKGLRELRAANDDPQTGDLSFHKAALEVRTRVLDARQALREDDRIDVVPDGEAVPEKKARLTRLGRRKLEIQELTAQALREIVLETEESRDMHAVDRAEILPESMRTLSDDPAERDAQVRGDKAFLVYFEMLYPRAHELDGFFSRLSEAGTDRVKIGPYLDHMSSCPGEPEAVRTDVAGIKSAYDLYRAEVDIEQLSKLDAGTRDFRREPLSGIDYERIIDNNINSVRGREADDRHRMVGTQLQLIAKWMGFAEPVLRAEGEFIEKTGMSRQVLRDFAKARDEVDGISKPAAERYASAALIAIELHTEGIIDAQSDHFQAFFNEVFPEYPLKFGGILDREINRLTEERARQTAEATETVPASIS